MILVLLAIAHGFRYLMVCQVFQFEADFGLYQPSKRIEPADDVDELAENHIHRVPLAGMGLLVLQYLLSVLSLQAGQVEEYPSEEGERVGFRGDTDDVLSVYRGASTLPSHPADTSQLHQETEEHDDDSYIIKV